jgi:hypothetical protein
MFLSFYHVEEFLLQIVSCHVNIVVVHYICRKKFKIITKVVFFLLVFILHCPLLIVLLRHEEEKKSDKCA